MGGGRGGVGWAKGHVKHEKVCHVLCDYVRLGMLFEHIYEQEKYVWHASRGFTA